MRKNVKRLKILAAAGAKFSTYAQWMLLFFERVDAQ
jgi:hypothetical protein